MHSRRQWQKALPWGQNWIQAGRAGAIFGVVEALTPVIVWGAGIAFALLSVVDGRMVRKGWQRLGGRHASVDPSAAALIATAIGTSLNGMAVDVALVLANKVIAVPEITFGL